MATVRDRNFWRTVVIFGLATEVLPLAWMFIMPPTGAYFFVIALAQIAAAVVGLVAGRRHRNANGPIGMGLMTMFESTLWMIAVITPLSLVVSGLLMVIVLVGALALLLPSLLAAFVLSAIRIIPPLREEWSWYWSDRP